MSECTHGDEFQASLKQIIEHLSKKQFSEQPTQALLLGEPEWRHTTDPTWAAKKINIDRVMAEFFLMFPYLGDKGTKWRGRVKRELARFPHALPNYFEKPAWFPRSSQRCNSDYAIKIFDEMLGDYCPPSSVDDLYDHLVVLQWWYLALGLYFIDTAPGICSRIDLAMTMATGAACEKIGYKRKRAENFDAGFSRGNPEHLKKLDRDKKIKKVIDGEEFKKGLSRNNKRDRIRKVWGKYFPGEDPPGKTRIMDYFREFRD